MSTPPAPSTLASSDGTTSISTLSGSTNANLILPIVNIKGLVSMELNESNFLIWKQVFFTVLRSYNVQGHVVGSNGIPPATILDNDNKETINPEFNRWIQRDMVVQSWINATLSLDMLQLVISSDNTIARSIWLALEKHFLKNTTSQVYALKSELRALKKGSMSMGEYLQKIKGITDSLKSIEEEESDRDLVLTALHGLLEQYKEFVIAIRAQRSLPSFQELRLLLQQEVDTEHFEGDSHPKSGNYNSFYANRGRGGN
jgi:gag-polypeptide of LTR copia-type